MSSGTSAFMRHSFCDSIAQWCGVPDGGLAAGLWLYFEGATPGDWVDDLLPTIARAILAEEPSGRNATDASRLYDEFV